MQHIVFICSDNANRSQMAEAFACLLGRDQVVAYSAGTLPAATVHPKAIAAMQEQGCDLTRHTSKAIGDLPDRTYDIAVLMGCGETDMPVPARVTIEWAIPDPRFLPLPAYRQIRELIEQQVSRLLAALAAERAG